MPIDTRMKRFSMLNMATVHAYPVLFEADGVVDADDRAFLLHLYGGIALKAPTGLAKVTVTVTLYITRTKSETMYITKTKSGVGYI